MTRRPNGWLPIVGLLLAVVVDACGGAGPAAPTTTSSSAPAKTTSPVPSASPSITSLVVSGSVADRGAAAPFTATAHYADGTTKDVTTASEWATSNAAVADVNAAGIVILVGIGVCEITATYEGVSGSRTIVAAS